jgi:hypothetical protein
MAAAGAVAEKVVQKAKPKLGGGDKEPPTKNRIGGAGGDDDDEGNDKITDKEKSKLRGAFATKILRDFKGTSWDSIGPMDQMTWVNMVREMLSEQDQAFKTAWDLKEKKMHFYVTQKSVGYDKTKFSRFRNMCSTVDNEDEMWNPDQDPKKDAKVASPLYEGPIMLNADQEYVLTNMIIDEKTGEWKKKKTQIPEGVVFVPYDFVDRIIVTKLSERESQGLGAEYQAKGKDPRKRGLLGRIFR